MKNGELVNFADGGHLNTYCLFSRPKGLKGQSVTFEVGTRGSITSSLADADGDKFLGYRKRYEFLAYPIVDGQKATQPYFFHVKCRKGFNLNEPSLTEKNMVDIQKDFIIFDSPCAGATQVNQQAETNNVSHDAR